MLCLTVMLIRGCLHLSTINATETTINRCVEIIANFQHDCEAVCLRFVQHAWEYTAMIEALFGRWWQTVFNNWYPLMPLKQQSKGWYEGDSWVWNIVDKNVEQYARVIVARIVRQSVYDNQQHCYPRCHQQQSTGGADTQQNNIIVISHRYGFYQ